MHELFFDLVLLFSFYSIIGWIIETVFKSIRDNQFVNSGFLVGPFCPIYGFGALLVLKSADIVDQLFNTQFMNGLAGKLAIAILITTLLEYFVGIILENLFKCKWWDYSTEALNIKGRICLKYSIIWGILAYLLIEGIHPLYSPVVTSIKLTSKSTLVTLIIVYLLWDTVKSVNDILNLRQLLFKNYQRPLEQFSHKMIKYRRIYSAFPRLHFPRIGKVNQEIRGFLNGKIEKLRFQIKNMHL